MKYIEVIKDAITNNLQKKSESAVNYGDKGVGHN